MMPDGACAPDFTVDVANGPRVVLSEVWREHYVLLWFSRGLACPFCRRQMLQLAQIQDELRRNNTSAIQMAPATLDIARSMLQFFPVTWPYGCDPDGRIGAAYGLTVKEGTLARTVSGTRQQARAWSLLLRHPAEPHPEVLPATMAAGPPPARDGGMVIIDPSGHIQHRQASGKLSLLPSNEDILTMLRQVVGGSS